MNNCPRIAVVMPVWNGEKYVRQAVQSILNQTFTDYELIVVDDGSTDKTVEIVRSYPDPRIRLFTLDHGGIVEALNFGISQARAPWIARQDADDLSCPSRLEWQWRAVSKSADIVLCHGNAAFIDEAGQRASAKKAHFPRSQALLQFLMLFKCPIIHTSVLFRRDVFCRAGGYSREHPVAQDYGLWGKMFQLGVVVGISPEIIHFRVHPNSTSQKREELQRAIGKQLQIQHAERFTGLCRADAMALLAKLHSQNATEWMEGVREYVRHSGQTVSLEMLAWIGSQWARRKYRKLRIASTLWLTDGVDCDQ